MNRLRMYVAVVAAVMLVFTACASVKIQEDSLEVMLDVAAFTLGYVGYDGHENSFVDASEIIRQGLEMYDADQIDMDTVITGLRKRLAAEITEDPLLQYQVEKVLGLLDITIAKEGPVDIPEDKERLVKIVLKAFVAGVNAKLAAPAGVISNG